MQTIIIRTICFVILVLLLPGCANNMGRLALTPKTKSIAVTEKSIALLVFDVSNENKPGYQPWLRQASISRDMPGKSAKRGWNFLVNKSTAREVDGVKRHLLTLSLSPGKYDTASLLCGYEIPIIFGSSANLFLKTEFDVPASSVVYLGHIRAIVKKRNSETELRAGPMFPLIDQAVAGFSNGTWAVSVEDDYEKDIQALQAEFPVLRGCKIEKSVMPSSTTPEADPYPMGSRPRFKP